MVSCCYPSGNSEPSSLSMTLASPLDCEARQNDVTASDPLHAVGRGGNAITPHERTLLLLLLFTFFSQFLPSEPFLTDFFTTKGFTNAQITDEIFDIWIYVRLPSLFAVGLLAEWFGSAAIIFVGALSGFVTVSMEIACTQIECLQATQFTVAISTAAHSGAFFALLFELCAQMQAARCQLYVYRAKAILLLANLVAGLAGSVLRHELAMPYIVIWVLSWCSQLMSVLVAGGIAYSCFRQKLLAPPLCDDAACSGTSLPHPRDPRALRPHSVLHGSCSAVWRDVLASFRLVPVAEWTLWSVAMHTAHIMVTTFWQPLLRSKTHREADLNGYVNAIAFALGAAAVLGSGSLRVLAQPSNRRWIILTSMLVGGVLVFATGAAEFEWQVYVAYVVFQVIFRVASAVATLQIGLEIRREAAAATGIAKPRLALVISLTEVFGACSQICVETVLKGLHGGAHGGKLPLAARFEILGVGVVGIALAFATVQLLACFGRALR
eukprot:TRINITY_DN46939_c0_g1_i1.p1 TRINITY_DN46939_c0_g1~~TRINITY_DN46939_c0_g1_i1.p1  ORF type:complete len:495 (-),score=85.85 TRINITY_DN46939_c0_g1_i1:154-1638(-)